MADFVPSKKEFSAFPTQDVVDEREQENAILRDHEETLKSLIERYDERIAYYLSLDAIPIEIARDSVALSRQIEINKEIVRILREERGLTETLIQ